MPITVNCQCGHQFRVRDEYAGKKAQCPACGDPVMIPAATFQPPTMNESPMEFPQMATGGSPATFPGARRSGGQWVGGINSGLFGLGRLSGLACLLVGLVFVLLARGCDALALHSASAKQAAYTLAQSEFNAKWEDRKAEWSETIEDKRKELDEADTPTETDSIKDELDAAQKKHDQAIEDEQRERRDMERGEWKELRRDADNARSSLVLSQRWRELLFVMGTIILAVGLLTVGFSGEPHERLICLIMIAIITFSVYVGGMAWISTVISSATSAGPAFR